MSSTILTTSRRTLPIDDSQRSAKACSALPFIPRRTSSSSLAYSVVMSAPASPSELSSPLSAMLIVQPPTPPENTQYASPPLIPLPDSDSSSSTPSDAVYPTIPRRANKNHAHSQKPKTSPTTPYDPNPPPKINHSAQTRPTPLAERRTPLRGAKLRLNLESVKSQPIESSSNDRAPDSSPSPPADVPTPVKATLGRKKSGEPLKSSLKSSKRLTRGSLDVITGTNISKSEPVTPTHSKAVHFDAQLEYVKLFLAEQRPLAVSRDGSPTDTSGTDSDFPSFIYGTDERIIAMEVKNVPSKIRSDAEVALEDVKLSPDRLSVLGRIRVRNLAFEKWVAVRFTFDSWQTTSEVTARYLESLDAGKLDRFAFTIRLNDIITRIDGKVLLFALRYVVAGREIWDNNGGANYVARFYKVAADPKPGLLRSGDLSDLKSKLEKVVKSVSPRYTPASPARVGSADGKTPSLMSPSSLSLRYDLGAYLRNPSVRPPSESPTRNQRPNSYPPLTATAPWTPQKAPPPTEIQPQTGPRQDACQPVVRSRASRKHARGYLDRPMADCANVRRTPPGSPDFFAAPALQEKAEGTDETTPSATSASSSVSSSPTLSPTEALMMAKRSSPWAPSLQYNNDYRKLLNQFCFYTSPDTLGVPPETIPRSHSDSSVQDLLCSPHAMNQPVRSPSMDELALRSGSATPTSAGFFSSGSRSSTPIAG